MTSTHRLKTAFALALPLLFDVAPATVNAAPLPPPQPAAVNSPAPGERDRLYPFYMPMGGFRAPAVTLKVKCDASREAGREVYYGRGADGLGGRVEGGFELVYDALDAAGNPCVYPFAPFLPQVAGSLQGTQYILRSSMPGRRVAFRTGDDWASVDLRLFEVGDQRVHFEMRDVELDFPAAIMPKAALHLEVTDTRKPGLFTAVIRRSTIYGGKNGLFVPNGQTMLYVEDSDIAGNVGTNTDQEHTTYINGTLVSHFRNTVFHGQRAYENMASGHQLKDKAYLRIYENVTVSNVPRNSTASAMPLIDASAFGFTWADGLRIERMQSAQTPRDTLVDLRTDIRYGEPGNYPWNVVADPSWRMPADPLRALDKVYLSVFMNTAIESFRDEPWIFALRQTGYRLGADGSHVEGDDDTTREQQRAVSIAFGTSGNYARVYSEESTRRGWAYVEPELPAGAEWVTDRDAFVRHALGLIGR
ncbi:hypothetical protein [Novosphingobium resinovorum]|uniref:hypothetical protein n=1 Tax=Novosphingobium resinovorum TaxID=158500 RepID=UPI002ED573AB|nr:hypothetical protein [Novosphingobium resinovorum]